MLHEVLSASLSSLPSTSGFIRPISFISILQGSRTSRSTLHATTASVVLSAQRSSSPGALLLPSGVTGLLCPRLLGESGFLIILLTVHLSDKTEERERPPASLSFNGQTRNEGEVIKAGAEPESLFNVSDRPDRIINQELKEFKTFALGFLT